MTKDGFREKKDIIIKRIKIKIIYLQLLIF